MTILLTTTGWNAEAWIDRLSRLLPGHTIVQPHDDFDPAAVRYAVAWKPRPGVIARCPNLEVILSLGAGVDHLLCDPSLPEVPLVRVVDPDLTTRMSEWVVLHALLHLRQLPYYIERQREAVWHDLEDQPAAPDVRVGVMGLGVMGLDALPKLKALGFRVQGWSRTPKTIPGIATFAGVEGLDAFLAATDILVSVLPLTPDTRGILDARLFAKLARDGRLGAPVLINGGRGGLQVEADILAALDDGTLKAASLDVFETEPLPPESPLWRHPKVLVSPHNAAISDPDAVGRYVADQILAFERGEPLTNVVDRRAGY